MNRPSTRPSKFPQHSSAKQVCICRQDSVLAKTQPSKFHSAEGQVDRLSISISHRKLETYNSL